MNPQRENGHREIANDVFRELVKAQFTGAEYKVCLCIINHSWGYGKTSDVLSTHLISKETSLSLRMVKLTLKSLKERRVICLQPSKRVKRGSPLNEYLFNKHWDTWKARPVKRASPVQQITARQVNSTSPTKESMKRKYSPRPSPGKELLEWFKAEYMNRLGRSYHIDHFPKQQGLCSGLLSKFGTDRVKKMMTAFLCDRNPWLVEQGHTLWQFSKNLNKYARIIALQIDGEVQEYDPRF